MKPVTGISPEKAGEIDPSIIFQELPLSVFPVRGKRGHTKAMKQNYQSTENVSSKPARGRKHYPSSIRSSRGLIAAAAAGGIILAIIGVALFFIVLAIGGKH